MAGGAVEAALRQVMAEHTGSVYRLALSIVHDSALADDVVQDTMVKAWRALPQFDDHEIPRAWLLKVARNTAISMLRSRREDVREPADLSDVAALGGGPADTTLGRLQLEALWAALAEMEESSRSLIVMRELSGLSYEEIAEVVELPLSTVKTRLFRARRALQVAMEEWRR